MHGTRTDDQPLGYLGIGQPLRHSAQHLDFALGQPVIPLRRASTGRLGHLLWEGLQRRLQEMLAQSGPHQWLRLAGG